MPWDITDYPIKALYEGIVARLPEEWRVAWGIDGLWGDISMADIALLNLSRAQSSQL